MKFSDESYKLRIDFDTKNFELSAGEIAKLEKMIDPLRKPVEKFPVAVLYLTIEAHPRSGSYRVKAALQLPGRTLASGSVDAEIYPAVQQSIRGLVDNVLAYEERMEGVEETAKHVGGTREDVVPERQVDPAVVESAVREGDYARFRELLFPYEAAVERRVVHWLERYPQIEARMGWSMVVATVVEEVFLSAFDEYDERPAAVPFGDWLEGFVDPSVKSLASGSEEDLENVSFVKTLTEMH